MTTNKTLIQECVNHAHELPYIVETPDFISGAYYMLEYLKSKQVLTFKNVGTSEEIHTAVRDEHNEIFKNLNRGKDK